MKNTLLALALTAIALGAYAPVSFAETGVPAVFLDRRNPTAEELADGTPLAVAIKQIKAIQADAAALKADRKSKGKLDAIWATMTPEMKKDQTKFGLEKIRLSGSYQGLKDANLDPKTMKINVTLSEGGYIIINMSYHTLPEGGGGDTFVMKKTDKGWLNCTLDELPKELLAKTNYRK